MNKALSILNIFTGPKDLAILWSDGNESYLPYARLRNACPCAHCQGEPDVLGRVELPVQNVNNRSFELSSVEQAGGYAVRLKWKDGHATGLYTYDKLRGLAGL